MKKIITSVFLLSAAFSYAQSALKGKVTDQNNQPIVGAEVFWESTDVSVTTDEEGNFEIKDFHPSAVLGVFYNNQTTTLTDVENKNDKLTNDYNALVNK